MSSFTNWNGPQGCGPTKDMWQELINEYKQLLDSNNYVQKVAGKGLSTEDFTTALKNKLEAINEGTASKDIGNVASGSAGLVTGDAVYQFCKDFVKGVAGQGFSTNDFSNAYKNILDSIKEAASRDVAVALTDADAKLVTVAVINTALQNYVQKETGKGLSVNDFTDDYVNLLKIITEYSIRFNFKQFGATVGGSNERGVFYLLGMLDDRAGTAYIRFTDTHSFAAVVNFAITTDLDAQGKVVDYKDGQLSITTDCDKADFHNVHFLIVKGTSAGKQHVYLAIQADEWMRQWEESGIINAGLFSAIPFEGSGINFIPVDGEGYVAPTGTTEVLYDVDYFALEDRMSALEARFNGIVYLQDVGTIRAWPKFNDSGVAVDVPDGFHACDGSAVDPALTELIAIIGNNYPLVDYHIVQTQRTVKEGA